MPETVKRTTHIPWYWPVNQSRKAKLAKNRNSANFVMLNSLGYPLQIRSGSSVDFVNLTSGQFTGMS